MAERTTIPEDPEIQEHQRPPDVSQGTPSEQSEGTTAFLTDNWENEFSKFFGTMNVHPGRKATIERLYKELHLSMAFLYHAPVFDKAEASTDCTFTAAINELIAHGGAPPGILVTNFLDPIDPGPLLGDFLKIYQLEKFVRDHCLAGIEYEEPQVNIDAFSPREYIKYCRRGRRRKSESYIAYETEYEQAVEEYVKKKIQKLRANAGPREVLTLPNPFNGPSTFYTRVYEPSLGQQSQNVTTPVNLPVTTPVGHHPSIQNEGTLQPTTPRPTVQRFAETFEALHDSKKGKQTEDNSTPQRTFDPASQFKGNIPVKSAELRRNDDDEDTLTSHRDYPGENGFPKLIKRTLQIPKSLKFNPTEFNQFKIHFDVWCARNNCNYLVDPTFQDLYVSDRSTALMKYRDPMTGKHLQIQAKQVELDVNVMHGWLLDALAGTDASHFADVPGEVNGILVYKALANEYLSIDNREIRKTTLEILINRPYRANESLTKFVSAFRANMNKYNVEAERDRDRLDDQAQRRQLLRLLRSSDDLELRTIARSARSDPNCSTMGSLCAFLQSVALEIDATANNDARNKSRTGRRHVNLTSIESDVSSSDDFHVYAVAVSDELNLTDAQYNNMAPDVKQKFRKARMLARMWLKQTENTKSAPAASSAKTSEQQKLPKQYSGRGKPKPGEQQGISKPLSARANIAIKDTTMSDSEESDNESIYNKFDNAEDPFDASELNVLLAATYVPTELAPYNCNMVAVNSTSDPSTFHAQLARVTGTPYAICDNGAQICILGGANDTWYIQTRDKYRKIYITGAVPSLRKQAFEVVSAITKVALRSGEYILLKAHECVLNPDTNVTLMSEFQLRDGGCVIDSIPLTHRTSFDHELYGTQSFQPAPGLFVPLHTRAALMTFDLIPPTQHDLATLPIYEITKNTPWEPRDHYNNSLYDIYNIRTAFISECLTTLTTLVPLAPSVNTTAVLASTLDSTQDDISVSHHPIDPIEDYWCMFSGTSQRFDSRQFADFVTRQFRGGSQDIRIFMSMMSNTDASTTTSMVAVDNEHTNETDRHPILDDNINTTDQELSNELADVGFRFKAKYTFDDIDKTRPYLGWATAQIIRETLKRTTQLAKAIVRFPMYRHMKARFPYMNVKRIREIVSTDAIFANVTSFDGYTGIQVFYGMTSHVITVYGLRSKDMTRHAIEDFINDEGAPWAFRMDNAPEQRSQHVVDLCRKLHIKLSFSEPNYQNQNPVESRAIKWIKHKMDTIMNRTNAPPRAFFHACRYAAELHNVTSDETLRYAIPYTVRHGETVDISCYLNFKFYEKIYYMLPESSFPDVREAAGYWMGVARNVGDVLTYEILTDDTQLILSRSVVRPITEGTRNQRLEFSKELDPDVNHPPPPFELKFSSEPLPLRRDLFQFRRNIRPRKKHPSNVSEAAAATDVSVRRISALPDPQPHKENGLVTQIGRPKDIPTPSEHVQPPIVPAKDIPDAEVDTPTIKEEEPVSYLVARTRNPRNRKKNTKAVLPTRKSSRLKRRNTRLVNNIIAQNIMDCLPREPRNIQPSLSTPMKKHLDYVTFNTYSQDVLDAIANPKASVIAEIVDHRGTTSTGTEVLVLWQNGGTSWHSVDTIRLDCPYAICRYVNKHALHLHSAFQWCHLTDANVANFCALYALTEDQQKKTRNYFSPRFKFGIEIPRNVRHALELDKKNGNTLWADAIQAEMTQINEHTTFIQAGGDIDLNEYTLIRYHIIFDVKFDLRRKARLVANGNGTEPSLEDVYSGVVAQDTIRIAFAIAAINGLLVCAGDVGNAFLYALTNEKVYIIAGPEFGELAGQPMVIHKGLYGLRTSSARFHEHLAATFRDLGFVPSRYDNDLWIRDRGDHYELIATYVDDVLVFGKEPLKIINILQDKYKMKGVGIPEYYLGGNIVELGPDWQSCNIRMALSAATYIQNSMEKLETMLATTFTPASTPMAENCHPELDDSEPLNKMEASQYRSLIGCANWIVTLGRIDIQYAVMALARFSMAPRRGHLKAMKRVFGYLKRHPKGMILCDPTPPDHSKYQYQHSPKWQEFYPDAEEQIPDHCPVPKGKEAFLTVYVDADHAHDVVTRRSVTGVLVLMNGMIIRSYSKRQTTVESSTYGSELVAARIAIDIIYEMRIALRVLGVPIGGPAMLLGDNKAVVINGTVPSSTIKKKHCSINYHRVREAIACRAVNFVHIPTEENIADLLTKPVPKGTFYRHMKMTIFRDPPNLEITKATIKPSNENRKKKMTNERMLSAYVKVPDAGILTKQEEGEVQVCHVTIPNGGDIYSEPCAWENYLIIRASKKLEGTMHYPKPNSTFHDWAVWVYEATCKVREQGYPVKEIHEKGLVWFCIPPVVLGKGYELFRNLYKYGEDFPEHLMTYHIELPDAKEPLKIPRVDDYIGHLGFLKTLEESLSGSDRLMIAYAQDSRTGWVDTFAPSPYDGTIVFDIGPVTPDISVAVNAQGRWFDAGDPWYIEECDDAVREWKSLNVSEQSRKLEKFKQRFDFGSGEWRGLWETYVPEYKGLDKDYWRDVLNRGA